MLGYGNFRGSGSSSGESSGGFRSGGFRGNSGGFRPRRSFGGPREMTKIKCAECGKEDEVPFKPRDGTSVLCKECYFKKKGITPRSDTFAEGEKKEKKFEDSESDSDEFDEADDSNEEAGSKKDKDKEEDSEEETF